MISVGIVGGTGYTGVELLRILLRHPNAEVKVLTSRTENGRRVDDMFPSLRGHTDLKYSDLNIDEAFQYLALDDKISMQKKGDIFSIEIFIQILTNRPILKKRKKFKAEEIVTEL